MALTVPGFHPNRNGVNLHLQLWLHHVQEPAPKDCGKLTAMAPLDDKGNMQESGTACEAVNDIGECLPYIQAGVSGDCLKGTNPKARLQQWLGVHKVKSALTKQNFFL